jgi:hypothetical protein
MRKLILQLPYKPWTPRSWKPKPWPIGHEGEVGAKGMRAAEAGIERVRLSFRSVSSVLTMAFSGADAANLGSGSRAVDSIFRTNAADAVEDLVGRALDKLVDIMRPVRLLVIDEISTVGSAQFAIVGKRLQQAARLLWRERFGTKPPEDIGSFGGFGIMLMGDFSQLPPVLSSSLLEGAPLFECSQSNQGCVALRGRQMFQEFDQVLRPRRIHRQKGADPYEESTMRLRGCSSNGERLSGLADSFDRQL